MGASPMSPAAMKAFSYGLPALSFLVTLWLPASVQLSFFVAGILSYIQSALFRNPKFRDRIGITALPAPTPAGPTTSGASSGPKLTVLDQNGAPVYSAPRQPTTIIEGFRKEVSTTINDVKESAKKTVEAAKEYTGQSAANGKRSKRELQEADKYEKKRQAEERARLEEVDRRRRAERQAKRARAQQGR
jgi:YidC/Oxa1 family membrane protein insertase